MLILTRRIGVSIQIGDDINVSTLDIKSKLIHIVICTADNVHLHREGIYVRCQTNLDAAEHLSTQPEHDLYDVASRGVAFNIHDLNSRNYGRYLYAI